MNEPSTFPAPILRRVLIVGAAALLGLGVFAPGAQAGGMFNVAECSPGHTGTPDASVQGPTTDYSAGTSCGSGNWLQVQSASETAAGDYKQWAYSAPPGTRIERFRADYSLVGDVSPDGHRSYFFIKRWGENTQEKLSQVGLGSTSGTYDSTLQDLGPFSSVGVGVFCSKSIGTCEYAPGQFARLSAITFRIEDLTPPSPPVVVGDAADGEWVSGSTSVVVGDIDVGGGVNRTTIEVNGTQIANDVICDPGLDGNGFVSSMTPCDTIELRPISVPTAAAPFIEGSGNAVRVCTHEFGVGAASTCTMESFRVDNVAPAAPQGLSVAGGSGWRRDNYFDLEWNNPTQSGAPIVEAVVTVSGPGGTNMTTYSGADIESAEGVSVPGVGAYTADVHLVDQAGNELAANRATTTLKFDDTVPAKTEPEKANGWLSREEVESGHEQIWSRPTVGEEPPSGIAGYRSAVDSETGTDPCAGSSDLRACGGQLTELGVGTTHRVLREDDLDDGLNYFHVVPVSGSGMRATAVGHTTLKVDTIDPTTTLHGSDEGWVNDFVHLEARAADDGSGMTDTDDYPDDAPPRTVLEIDGVAIDDSDADVSTIVADEGVHQIAYWARDLAGNENDGSGGNAEPGRATVRIDRTAPTIAFRNQQDPDDPDRLIVHGSDGLSGIASGSIEYRRAGATSWTALDTTATSAGLSARADSESLDPGVDYEFRAVATDAAGNATVTDRRANGTRMSTTGPFRRQTSFSSLTVNGSSKAKVPLGRAAVVKGRLADSSGAGVADASVDLIQSYAPGSTKADSTIPVRTSPSGGFVVRLPKGPSRSIEARFGGDLRALGSRSTGVRLQVKSKVGLSAPRRVEAGSRAVFSGKVKAPGARFSGGGKSVEVQVRVGSRWKTVGRSIRTDGRGKYRLRYRFVASYTRPVRYRFRTVVLRERGWPYLPSVSKQRKVVVSP